MKLNIETCPFCRSDEVRCYEVQIHSYMVYYVGCEDCGAESPEYDIEKTAIQNWNDLSKTVAEWEIANTKLTCSFCGGSEIDEDLGDYQLSCYNCKAKGPAGTKSEVKWREVYLIKRFIELQKHHMEKF